MAEEIQRSQNSIESIGKKIADKPLQSKNLLKDPNVPSFKDTLKNFLTDVNSMQNHADKSIEKMVAGEITDVHQVMMAVGQANLSFNLMMEIRQKMTDAYQELMRMQV